MRVALITAPEQPDVAFVNKFITKLLYNSETKLPPIGLLYLASYLERANHKVKIFNINGRLTKVLSQDNGSIQGSRAFWDGHDSNNNLVPSGIYIYLVFNDEGLTGRGKIAVVKP